MQFKQDRNCGLSHRGHFFILDVFTKCFNFGGEHPPSPAVRNMFHHKMICIILKILQHIRAQEFKFPVLTMVANISCKSSIFEHSTSEI